MPYIKPEQRELLDPAISYLASAILNAVDGEGMSESDGATKLTPGLINYTITTLLLTLYDSHQSYSSFNAMVGMLECAKLELYRKHVGPYEDQKEYDNGAVKPL